MNYDDEIAYPAIYGEEDPPAGQEFNGPQKDFARHFGRSLHSDKLVYDALTQDRLKDHRWNQKQTAKANIRKFTANISFPFRQLMLKCPTWLDLKWYSHYGENHSFYTELRSSVYAEFEQALFGDPLRSLLPLSSIAQVAGTTIEDVIRFFRYGDLTIDFRGLGGTAARHINHLDDVDPEFLREWEEQGRFQLHTLGAFPDEICLINEDDFSSEEPLTCAVVNDALAAIWNTTSVGTAGLGTFFAQRSAHKHRSV